MIKLKTKNVKPIEIDAHFKYRCPKCGWDHWVSLKESQTKNFKIVCDCDTIFKPKRIKNISIEYFVSKPKRKNAEVPVQTIQNPDIQPEIKTVVIQEQVIKPVDPLDKDILEKGSKLLISYGFTVNESKALLNEAYERIKNNNVGLLVKNVLEFIGDK